MIAVDANVILRAVLEDDSNQTPIAQRLLASELIFIPVTVVLEVVWTLLSRERRTKAEVLATLRSLFGQANVTVQDEPVVRSALEWADTGLDIADALHLASAADCVSLRTFDKVFISVAKRIDAVPVRAP